MATYNLPPHSPIGVGVSGGADSMALVLLLKDWCQKNAHPLIALTVDHQLRPESREEALFVASQMKKWGMKHHILSWSGKKPQTRIEEKAREARYTLLSEFCATRGISYLCMAHHSSDQAETFLSRLARGSGMDGLAAMKPYTRRGNLTILRPLLSCDKNDLIHLLKSHHLSWKNDPMNEDDTYERVRWRKHLTVLQEMGLSLQSIYLTTKRLARAAEALQETTQNFIQKHVTIDPRGFALIDKTAFTLVPDEIKLRSIGKLIELIGQSGKPTSYDSLEKVVENLPRKATLGHCHIITHKRGIFISKESVHMAKAQKIKPYEQSKWDRFVVQTNLEGVLSARAPKPREKDIPFLVQQSFPHFSLEKNPKLDYKDHTTYIDLIIDFYPQNKG